MLRVSQLAVLALASVSAAGAAPCPERSRGTLDEWQCYGEVEYASRAEGEADFGARFVAFANGERLHEKRTSEGAKTRLMGEGWSLYRGFSREVLMSFAVGQFRRALRIDIWILEEAEHKLGAQDVGRCAVQRSH